jgi:hypothetical protein
MVMTKAPIATPNRAVEMGRKEAEEITQTIKNNFDSLGTKLAEARTRKAYKALGYRTFETYCQSEFGKSVSSAYQLIEDAKVLAQLEARISEEYGEDVTLKFPSSHLKPLKEIDNIDDQLKAIEYAQRSAAAENRKATKKDLEIAVFHVSGKRSEDFKEAIQALGFRRGVQIEISKSFNKDRGFVTKVDKGGKIYIELNYGGVVPIPYDAADLRILSEDEQPVKPLTDDITNKGDRVLIFSPALKGKEGTIFQWKPGKQALVMVDGQNSPVDVAYAEMQLSETSQQKADWQSELVWEEGKNTYHYSPQHNIIYSDKWPHNLSLQVDTRKENPIKFIQDWESKFADSLLNSLTTPTRVKTLTLAQAIELPQEEGKKWAADLITSLNQLFPPASEPPKALGISFSRTIDELISGKKTQTRRAWQDDYAKNFIRYFDENIAIPVLDQGRHRGGQELGFIRLTQRPYQQYLSEMSALDLEQECGMVATVQEFIDTFFEGQDKLVWVLHFEFLATPNANNTDALVAENQRLREQLTEAEATIQAMASTSASSSSLASPEITDFLVENTAEISSPGEAAAHADFLVENTAEISSPGEAAAHTDFLVENTAEISSPGDTTDADWKSILTANNFTPNYDYTDNSTEQYRGWKIYLDPNGSCNYVDLNHPEKGAFCCDINWISQNIKLESEDEVIQWAKGVINQIEDFCPGQLSLFPAEVSPPENIPDEQNPSWHIDWLNKNFPVPPKIAHSASKDSLVGKIQEKLEQLLEKTDKLIETLDVKNPNSRKTKKESRLLKEKEIKNIRQSIKNLELFQHLQIGMLVNHHRDAQKIGVVANLTMSVGGMPEVWVKWDADSIETSESVHLLHFPQADEGES